MNITPLTKYIRLLTEYQILILGIQPNIELFGCNFDLYKFIESLKRGQRAGSATFFVTRHFIPQQLAPQQLVQQ